MIPRYSAAQFLIFVFETNNGRGKIIRFYIIFETATNRGDVSVTKIGTEHNLADPFTKTLASKTFEAHFKGLGLRDMSHLL